eukprot:COSAG01_NODE_3365_length_6192_cov_3.999179_1_plen_148_part_00
MLRGHGRGQAAHACLEVLEAGDEVGRILRRAGYDADARPAGCSHGMFSLSDIAGDDDGRRAAACALLARDLLRIVKEDEALQAENAAFDEQERRRWTKGRGGGGKAAAGGDPGGEGGGVDPQSMVLLAKMSGVDLEKNLAYARRFHL